MTCRGQHSAAVVLYTAGTHACPLVSTAGPWSAQQAGRSPALPLARQPLVSTAGQAVCKQGARHMRQAGQASRSTRHQPLQPTVRATEPWLCGPPRAHHVQQPDLLGLLPLALQGGLVLRQPEVLADLIGGRVAGARQPAAKANLHRLSPRRQVGTQPKRTWCSTSNAKKARGKAMSVPKTTFDCETAPDMLTLSAATERAFPASPDRFSNRSGLEMQDLVLRSTPKFAL